MEHSLSADLQQVRQHMGRHASAVGAWTLRGANHNPPHQTEIRIGEALASLQTSPRHTLILCRSVHCRNPLSGLHLPRQHDLLGWRDSWNPASCVEPLG
jgi:hypothetical protein